VQCECKDAGGERREHNFATRERRAWGNSARHSSARRYAQRKTRAARPKLDFTGAIPVNSSSDGTRLDFGQV
jgi:hypothetical protein